MKNARIWWRCSLALAAASLVANSALAQTLEEVVVTAQKRAESQQDVPIAIDAFTGEQLSRLGVHSAQQILSLVPNAMVVDQGGGKQNFFVRGVGTADFHLNVVGAVGVFLDDAALNSPFAVSFATFDMERVELLRGPQNTLFGKNTTGGAVNYISHKPNVADGLNGYLQAGFGRYSQVDLEGAVGFPLGERAAVRLAAVSNTRDGVFHNVTLGQDVGEIDRQAARIQLLVDATENFTLLANIHGGQSGGDPQPFKGVGFLDPTDQTLPCAVPLDQIIPQNNPNCANGAGFVYPNEKWENVYGNLKHRQDLDTHGAGLNMEWRLASMTITSTTTWETLKVDYNEDADASPTTIFQFYQGGDYDQWSQELRAASTSEASPRWIAGLYYYSEDASYTTAVRRTPDPLAPSGPDQFNVTPNTMVDQEDRSFSAFGQLEFDLQDDLTLTTGFRWTNETKKGQNAVSVRCVGPNGGPPFCPSLPDSAFLSRSLLLSLPVLAEPPVETLDGDWSEWGARVALDYKVSDSAMLYASVSRGFKGGGFSIAALQALLGLAAQDVEPEILWAYEFGIKSDWADETVRLNAAMFYYDWKGLQSFQPLIVPGTGTAVPQLLNVPKSSLQGFEAELTWLPSPGWYLQAGIGLNDSRIEDAGLIAGISAGNKLPNVPDVTFTGMVRREIPMASGTLALQANIRYQGDVTYDLANARNLSQDAYWTASARGSYRFGERQQFEVGVWGENLTGEKYCNGMTSLAGLSESNLCVAALSEPTYGINATIRF
ncbi:MAG: TonB-dependent receptor [Steroidobacteraceae bacterium]